MSFIFQNNLDPDNCRSNGPFRLLFASELKYNWTRHKFSGQQIWKQSLWMVLGLRCSIPQVQHWHFWQNSQILQQTNGFFHQIFESSIALRESKVKHMNETVKLYLLEKLSDISNETDTVISTNNIFIMLWHCVWSDFYFLCLKSTLHQHTPKSHCFHHTD